MKRATLYIHEDSYLSDPAGKNPEKKLLGAILVRAAQDAVSNKVTIQKHHRSQAIAFFGLWDPLPNLHPGDGTRFSFRDCCEYLNLCPFSVHRRLRRVLYNGGIDGESNRHRHGTTNSKIEVLCG